MADEQRAPIKIEGLTLGDEGQLTHFNALATREEAAAAAKDLEIGDAAFIKRSDLKWTYAVVAEKDTTDAEGIILRFDVDVDKNRKSFPEKQWGKYIRVVAKEAAEPAPAVAEVTSPKSSSSIFSKISFTKSSTPKAEPEVVKAETETPAEAALEEVKEEAKPAEPVDATSQDVSTLSDSCEVVEKPEEKPEEKATAPSFAAPSLGWISGFFSGSASQQDVSIENTLKESAEVAPEQADKEEPVVVPAVKKVPTIEEEPVEVPTVEDSVMEAGVEVEAPVAEEEEDKENNDAPKSEEKEDKKRSIFQKISFSRSSSNSKKVTISTPNEVVKSPKSKKEWFDPKASEVDYDKNPTDLFQALEARQWAYALAMMAKDKKHFEKDCSTWVVAKGKKKGAALRFRALPLHAAVVFGCPDDLTKAILEAYPLAARGRDVKGRLPVHLACEHDVSDEILVLLINSFPKAFYVKDKLEKTPLDYMNDNGNRKWIKKMIPSLISTKIEDEKTKWDAEKEKALLEYREALKSDPEYTKDVTAVVEDATETKYANKFELIELSHKKEIELLKMKHAEETRALLEGFEVKLNFERKLQTLKAKE
eukprot:CAMPEP_0201686108 /NCGR_PEP_ID=MMETSP0578-20130828/670_1 /ASSEMBLY_ACC=CAM_ASM_000663 /TAXON_ID=267565 /ORGANISM="Skeletonema grethea, Strain CCMP 1804" /LENGTH=592 /DNA_ID=CAMNT_0048170113 /DNA_START=25 /DNA_END=1803 /DNA_ORIENTATION=+